MKRSIRRRKDQWATGLPVEVLEPRRLLCGLPHAEPQGAVVELAPETIDPRTGISPASGREVLDPADIIWVNRGLASDNFAARFGASANTARAVVDAVIVAYERMIGSFDYPTAGQTYSLTLSMSTSGSGFGASAGLGSSLGGKPKSGTITMGAGNGSANVDDTNGWFMDPTPFESSEFLGTIQHAFTGDAQGGSPAAGLGDFYTVVAAEMTHCMGLFGSALTGWVNRTTNTGIADSTAGPGFYYTFSGPSIQHLLTSDNAGSQDFGSAVHSAEGPGANITFGGVNYIGTHDQGNPIYEFGRRYLVNHPFGLMFKDAYGYASNNPAQFNTGTFFSMRTQATNLITVRGQSNTSNIISITRSGSTISVSVDPLADVAGSGNLAGNGNLAAWVTNYDISEVASISITGTSNADTITIGSDVGVPITVNAAGGTDSLTFQGTSAGETMNITSTTLTSGLTSVTLTPATVESIIVNAGGGADTISVSSTATGVPVTVNGTAAGEFYFLGSATSGNYPAGVTINGAGGADTAVVDDGALAGTSTYTFSATQLLKSNGFGGLTYNSVAVIAILGETGSNTFNVNATATNMELQLNGGSTLDTYNVQGTGTGAVVTFNSGAGADVANVNTDNTGTATAQQLAGSLVLGSLNIGTGGLMNVTAGGAKVLTTSTLSIPGSGKLDLFDNDMIIDYSGASVFGAIQSLVNSARNGGAWNGSGITSSTAGANPLDTTTLGVMEGSDYDSIYGAGGLFSGQNPDATSILVKYTYYGDADYSGSVDFDDYVRTDSGFNTGGGKWVVGDFDGSGTVDFDDYVLLDLGFNSQGAPL